MLNEGSRGLKHILQKEKMPYFHMVLRAVKPEININRVYAIHLDKGLFNTWVVTTAYGRFEGGSIQQNHGFSTIEEAKAFIDKILKKRQRSYQRIRCDYNLISMKSSLAQFANGAYSVD